MSARSRQAFETPSGPPMTKHRSRPSPCHAERRFANPWLVNCLPRSSRSKLLSSVDFTQDLFAFQFPGLVGSVVLAATSGRNRIETKSPFPGEACRVSVKSLIDPGRLTVSDSNQSNVHDSAVGCCEVTDRSQRPELLQIIELAHFG